MVQPQASLWPDTGARQDCDKAGVRSMGAMPKRSLSMSSYARERVWTSTVKQVWPRHPPQPPPFLSHTPGHRQFLSVAGLRPSVWNVIWASISFRKKSRLVSAYRRIFGTEGNWIRRASPLGRDDADHDPDALVLDVDATREDLSNLLVGRQKWRCHRSLLCRPGVPAPTACTPQAFNAASQRAALAATPLLATSAAPDAPASEPICIGSACATRSTDWSSR